MKRSPRRLAACVPAVILLATSLIMGTASLAGDTLPPRLSMPNPQPASAQEAAPAPQNAAAPAAPAPSSASSAASEQTSTAVPQVQTGPPPIGAEVADCQQGEGSLLTTSPAVFKQISMEQAWDVTEGQGVVVTAVDSGVDANNPHLQGTMAPRASLLGRGDDQRDDNGHGTAVAGMIAARQMEGSSVVGIAKSATITPVWVYQGTSDDQVKKGVGSTPTRTTEGIQWVADNGARVVVIGHILTQDESEVQAAVNRATEVGALVVAGAGAVESIKRPSRGAMASTPPPATDVNGAEIRYPAAYSNVLGVMSLDANGSVPKDMLHGSHADVTAPAQAVPATLFEEGDCLVSQSRPSPALAVRCAAGVAALVVATHPTETPADWKCRLTVTAIRPEPTKSSPATGWRLIAPYAALNFVNDGTTAGPKSPHGTYPVPTPSPSLLEPIVPDPAPWRRVRLAGGIGVAGLVVLSLGLVASRTRGRKRA